ncbi:MAG TPA: BCAM0308 family protein [Deltaproteobacteria bacterium]|nr:BCAM0308 family protein [Deltaproteobacteria bacterium]HQI00471.1 BCAM0308 family protein [Deltaproteobacteria bacterium]HQJ07368.1 BCAM0308 family protein [Deltaproteobacteria bacterium]
MRLDKFIRPKSGDPYGKGRKYTEGMYCPACQALYHQGRWKWPRKGDVFRHPCMCSACRRIRDRFPAGEVHISGKYFNAHKNEIMNLVQNVITEEEGRSPLKRVIDFTNEKGRLCISFTDDHLARRIGDALHKAYRGDLDVKYSDGERFVRLYWHRDL